MVDEGVRQCAAACGKVMDNMRAVAAAAESEAQGCFGKVNVSRHLLGRVIGAGGSNVKALERSTGADYLFSFKLGF